MISDGMRGSMIGSKDDRRDRQSRLVQYMVDTLHLHNSYAAGYFLCEALNFINVVSFLINPGVIKSLLNLETLAVIIIIKNCVCNRCTMN
jgi:hypothetical protein